MFLKYRENTYLSIRDENGKIRNQMMFIVAKTGYGKGLLSENVLDKFHKAGYLVISLADPKKEQEMAYSMFKPEENYHRKHLIITGIKEEAKDVKLYHPFTFNIPRQNLPQMQFYTIPLKQLGRSDWSLIAESSWDTDTIKLLLNASQNVSRDDGLYGFLHYLRDIVKGKSEGRGQVRADPKNFLLDVTSGTSKSMQDISNYLQPFKQEYFLGKESSLLKLNWRDILQDQKHYHVFLSHWVKDPKLRSFLVLALLNQIIENKDYATHPVIIFIPEIRTLTPLRPQGYEFFLAQGIKEALSMIRSMGVGMSALYDTQVFSGVDEEVRNSPSVTLYGELGGASDIEKVSKAMNYKREVRKLLVGMPKQNCYLVTKLEGSGAFRVWFPPHMHAEPHYKFNDMYKKHFPHLMTSYTDLIQTMKKELDEEEDKVWQKIKKRQQQEKELRDKQKKERESSLTVVKKAEQKSQKADLKKDEAQNIVKQAVWDYYKENPTASKRSIGIKFKRDKNTIAKWIAELEKLNMAQQGKEDKRDFADSIVDELNNSSSE